MSKGNYLTSSDCFDILPFTEASHSETIMEPSKPLKSFNDCDDFNDFMRKGECVPGMKRDYINKE
jgi:hypothetical protein